MRLTVLFLLFAVFVGCDKKKDGFRDLVVNDTTGSDAALAMCLSHGDLPADACKRVTTKNIDNLLKMESPNDLYCYDAVRAARKFAPEKLEVLKTKCKGSY
jgi:hypothetical protein